MRVFVVATRRELARLSQVIVFAGLFASPTDDNRCVDVT